MTPRSYRGQSVAELERMRIHALVRTVDADWFVRAEGRDDLMTIDAALARARKREGKQAKINTPDRLTS